MKNIVCPSGTESPWSGGTQSGYGPTPSWLAYQVRAPRRLAVKQGSSLGRIPLLLWLASQGLPLGRTLEPSKPTLIEDTYARSLALTSQASSLSSGLQVGFLAAVYLLAALVVAARLHQALRLLGRHPALPLLLLLVGASALWSNNSDKVLMNLVHHTGAVLIAMAAALRYQADPWRLPLEAGYALGLALAVQLLAVGVAPAYAIDWEGRWIGLTGQANTLGALALCGFWANLAAAFARPAERAQRRLVSAVLAALSAVAMIGANSVTSMLSAACLLAAMLYLRHSGGRVLAVAGLLAMPVVTMLVVTLASTVNLSSVAGAAGRSGDFSGRTAIWADGIEVITKRPLAGWSFDDHAYVIRHTGMQYTTYHDGYVDLAVDGGVLAVLLLLLLLAGAMRQQYQRQRLGRVLRAAALPFMLALLVYNTTEASFVSARNPMWILLLTLTLLGAARPLAVTPQAGVSERGRPDGAQG